VIWLVIGLVVYFSYGRYHSRVQAMQAVEASPTAETKS